LFHDEVSSTVLAALFAVESAKDAVEEQNLPAVHELKKASELLSEAVEKTADVLRVIETSLPAFPELHLAGSP
jgi:hypothetical protein